MTLSRRSFLSQSLTLGCSAAASPLLTPVAFAAAPGDARLVVIILRGGMDGLGVVQPYGEAPFAALRGRPDVGAPEGPADLDGRFALHRDLAPLKPLWDTGGLGFAHAVSTPYRNKRSHFDGQDLLEAGTATLGGVRDGWLNRLLQVTRAHDPHTAFALGRENMILLSGAAPYSSWSPEADLDMSPQARLLAELVMMDDPAFADSLRQALMLVDEDDAAEAAAAAAEDMGTTMDGAGMPPPAKPAAKKRRRGGPRALAQFAGRQLTGAARIAAFSLNGWDTHRHQHRTLGRALGQLTDVLQTLQTELGPVWDRTAVLAMTEFGRTARLNGSAGTDHGTGGAMLFAGGALRGGQVVSDWPGLAEGDLYEGRDLMPTRDIRAHAAWVMRDLFGVSISDLEASVFPGLDMGPRSGLLL